MHTPWSEWDLSHWLTHLETRNTREIQLGLTRVLTVAQKLNLQRPNCKVITVAGTNGKGSTVTALETIYHQSGFRVGTYTSPHLLAFNERIRINLAPIQDKDLCQAFSVIEEARYPTNLTYFEMATLAALWYFKQHDLDLIILEVGLGGRLDATNIVDTDLAIITTIDFDHQNFLGDTLELIGYEKAGILRKINLLSMRISHHQKVSLSLRYNLEHHLIYTVKTIFIRKKQTIGGLLVKVSHLSN